MNTITVRPAKTKDSKRVFEFICDLEDTIFDYPVFEQYYLINISNKDNIYLVAINNADKVIGYLSCHGQILLHHVSKVFEIHELFVDRNSRNQKVGQLLIEMLEDILRKNNYTFLEVATNLKRMDTHRFYKKCGFNQSHYKFTKRLQ
ncbi:MAG: GNAT family N-acetyltransferase [Bacteroidia bacterium]